MTEIENYQYGRLGDYIKISPGDKYVEGYRFTRCYSIYSVDGEKPNVASRFNRGLDETIKDKKTEYTVKKYNRSGSNLMRVEGKFFLDDTCMSFESKNERIPTEFVYRYLENNPQLLDHCYALAGKQSLSLTKFRDIPFPILEEGLLEKNNKNFNPMKSKYQRIVDSYKYFNERCNLFRKINFDQFVLAKMQDIECEDEDIILEQIRKLVELSENSSFNTSELFKF